ncbi:MULTISPECIES: PAS domain S-box protein [Rhodomicrobium]|uniref:sensor histidine kinase n=1 Tax=Rhodomicrobium TaxID=1068 RepID=UPI000B4B95F1|nr:MULTISPECIES: PAS domain S-box protein [Rhodomicrobium]
MAERPDDPENPSNNDRLFRHVIESATGFAIFTLDPAGAVSTWNTGAERLLGFAEDEILGKSAAIIFTPEDRANRIPEFEMATALDSGRAEDERWHQRKDGSQFWGSGLMMSLGSGAEGFVKIMRDQTARRLAEERLARSEERFRGLVMNIPQLIFRTHANGERLWHSPQWESYTGLSEAASRDFGWLEAIHPEDRKPTLAAWSRAVELRGCDVEHRIRRASDGEYRWHQTRSEPVPETGIDAEWVGTSNDIHDLRALQDRQEVLLAELQHRSRNLLAVVHAMTRQTLRSSPTLEAFSAEFEGRLLALSRVQRLVSSCSRETVDLRSVIDAELLAHGGNGAGAISVDGPEVELPMSQIQTLALALHELVTNAVKYGAIGQEGARLSVRWAVEPAGAGRQVVLEWRESGVVMPDPTAPKRRGYGTELIERALPYQLKTETRFLFTPDGVHCTIIVPVEAEGAATGRP